MRDRLNFFEPWERLPANHENQLTRALLVVLRCCPLAHQAWLSLIDLKLSLQSLPRPTFDTQRARILKNEHPPRINEPIKGISILCAADAATNTAGPILDSDRAQVLDGIIRYGDEIVLVLESKLDGGADETQARNINLHGQPVAFDRRIRRISWRDVLASFSDLADESRALVSGAERMILSDFLSFVSTNFPQLGPFNTIARCHGDASRLKRRLEVVLSGILNTDGVGLPGTHTGVTTAYLVYENENQQIELRMYPADTLEQARALYERPRIVEQVLMLGDEKWRITPNFHFGFMAKGFDWTTTTQPLGDYLRYWQRHISQTTQIERRNWDRYWHELVETKIADPVDREKFDRNFTNTTRQTASPRPGMQCKFVWNLDEAERLDSRNQFAGAVKDRINQLLEAIGEKTIDDK